MQAINISEFRANLLKYLKLAHAGEQISISSQGQILATLSEPVDQKQMAQKQLRALAASAKLHDVVAPTGANWDANS